MDFTAEWVNGSRCLFFLYQETGEEKYRLAAENIMEELRGYPRCECGNFEYRFLFISVFNFILRFLNPLSSPIACFVYEEELRGYPRCECGNFVYRKECLKKVSVDALYMLMPFYMEYETVYGKKEKYGDIIRLFCRQLLHDFHPRVHILFL